MEATVRVLPHDDEAEKSVLGSIILDRQALSVAEEILRADEFYNPKHQEIFKAIISLSAKGENIDPLIISEELRKKGQLDNIGGLEYILDLSNLVGITSFVSSYANIVKEKAILRSLIKASDHIMQESYEASKQTGEIVELAEKSIFEITQQNHRDGLTLIGDHIQETIERLETMTSSDGGITGVTTGLIDLNEKLSGLQKSDLVLLAARPSMGKTALGINIGLSAAVEKNIVAVFSLEMSKIQLVQRILAQLASVNLGEILSGGIKDYDMIFKAIAIISEIPLYIDDTASISLTELRAKCRKLKAEVGLDLVVIDYLQLMTIQGAKESRQLEISEISRGLKALAKELNCPVLALAQLSRAPELRTNKRPILSDLRESGAIEQDADIVLMLYRDDYYEPESEEKNIAEVIIAKHRNGETGTVKLFFQKEYTKFCNLSHYSN